MKHEPEESFLEEEILKVTTQSPQKKDFLGKEIILIARMKTVQGFIFCPGLNINMVTRFFVWVLSSASSAAFCALIPTATWKC